MAAVAEPIRYRVWAGNDAAGKRRPDKWLTEAELMRRWDFARLHPEYRRRMLELFIRSGHSIGFLSGARSHAQQVALYAERNGVGVARPGTSWHEDDAYIDDVGNGPETWALAADLIEDVTTPADELALIDTLGPGVGLHDFSNVNDEEWHAQPDEFPNSRGAYIATGSKQRLIVWPFGTPAPAPGDDDVEYVLIVKAKGSHYLFKPGGRLMWFASDADRNATVEALEAAGVKCIVVAWTGEQLDAANNGGYTVPFGTA